MSDHVLIGVGFPSRKRKERNWKSGVIAQVLILMVPEGQV